MRKRFIFPLLAFSLTLSGCPFLNLGGGSTGTDTDTIKSFEFIQSDEMTIDSSGSTPFYLLTTYVGDTYQIRTDVDDQLTDDYHFEYNVHKDGVNMLEVSDSGLVTATGKGVTSVTVNLFKEGIKRRTATNHFIANIKEHASEYANITLTDSTLGYNANTKTYSLELDGGSTYAISYRINSNVSYVKTFELTNSSYSSFMSVSASGVITTQSVDSDINGKIAITTYNADQSKLLDRVYLEVTVKASTIVPEKQLVVIDKKTGTTLKENDEINLYVGESNSFTVKLDNVNKVNVTSISNSSTLELNNGTNTITGKAVGTSNVTFECEGKSLTIKVNVIKNELIEIYAKNEANDFAIVNNQLMYIGKLYAKFQSGLEEEITNKADVNVSITALDETYKRVTLSYTKEGVTKSVTYDVAYFVTEETHETKTAFNYSDYDTNKSNGVAYHLPSEGTVHMLVVPVWFTNSNTFFTESHKTQILEDLDWVYNSTRDKDEFYSVKQFFEQESNGKLTFNITISEFYECGKSSKAFGDTAESEINATRALMDSAITWYFANHTDESISDYDANNDGLVDAISLVYAANYYGTPGDHNGSTAFETTYYGGTPLRKYNNGSFSPIGGIYGFNKSRPELSAQLNITDLSNYYPTLYFDFNSGSKTIIHETGHMFGPTDLYEDNHASTKYSPAGGFSIQDHNYGMHDPYQMNLIGWSQPTIYSADDYEVGETVRIRLDDFATSQQNILLTNKWNEYNSLFDEYMLLELLAPTGLNYYDANHSFDCLFSDPGIRLWHVNSILENLSEFGALTQNIPEHDIVNLKYSNNNQSSEYDLAHWIRNNENEPYNTTTKVKDSYGLFMANDRFDINTYKSQFVNDGRLDNKEKFGWEFEVNSIFQNENDGFGAIITLTRVDNTKTDFEFESRIDKDVSTQPTTDGTDYATELFGSNELFSLVYNFNDATAPSYYTQGKPISYKGLCLFAEPNGNGGSLVLTLKDKAGYNCYITSISITSTMLTNVELSVIVDGQTVTGTSFTGPYNQYDSYNEKGRTYEINSKSVILQNKYTGGTDHHSLIALYSINISYHMEKIK